MRDGYGHVGPEVLLHAMIASQTGVAETETAMLADSGLLAVRRRHAKPESTGRFPADRFGLDSCMRSFLR